MTRSSDATRVVSGLVLSVVISLLASRKRSLSSGGAATAVILGTVSTAAGWSWAFLLISFFLSATALSRAGGDAKQSRLKDVVEKHGNRDTWQVLANGGLFGALALLSLVSPAAWIQVAAAGALAASTADTWATELGVLSRAMPRGILSWKIVTPGTSGGITALGVIASAGGAAFVAVIAIFVGWPRMTATAAIAGGICGSLIDSILGATVQERRWCESCDCGTERAVHGCGTRTIHAGGMRGVDNDVINFLSSVAGALVASLCLI